jgi:hypothetical protein
MPLITVLLVSVPQTDRGIIRGSGTPFDLPLNVRWIAIVPIPATGGATFENSFNASTLKLIQLHLTFVA